MVEHQETFGDNGRKPSFHNFDDFLMGSVTSSYLIQNNLPHPTPKMCDQSPLTAKKNLFAEDDEEIKLKKKSDDKIDEPLKQEILKNDLVAKKLKLESPLLKISAKKVMKITKANIIFKSG